ncbi:hypothetical protein C8R44DRAFT_744493 [Mycena epipterygia]|nr:hypothetical protein C8R44DRAFT_744493 [Mycena epipterygia]
MPFASTKTFNRYYAEFSRSSRSSPASLHAFLVAAQRQLYRDLYAEKTAEIYARAKLRDRNWIIAALRGGSTKKLAATANFISWPRSISGRDGSGKMLSEPEAPSSVPKPWLTTSSVLRVKECVVADPFEWPKPASVEDYSALLRRGNQKPAPGPDQWEKWFIEAFSEFALRLVLDLHNYIVMHSRFPGDLEDIPTSPIVVSGVTNQGGPASPLKAIYTTSLGHSYLDDIATQDSDSLVISTANSLYADPQLRDDSLRVKVTMVNETPN